MGGKYSIIQTGNGNAFVSIIKPVKRATGSEWEPKDRIKVNIQRRSRSGPT